EVEGEYLVGEAEAEVPGGVALVGDAVREGRDGVERVARAEIPIADVGRYVGAPARRQRQAREDVLGEARDVLAVSARVQHGGRPVEAAAERELFGEVIGRLGVDLDEADVRLDDVAIQQGHTLEGTSSKAVAQRDRVEALPARVPVVPGAEVEGELAEGRADAAVEVD